MPLLSFLEAKRYGEVPLTLRQAVYLSCRHRPFDHNTRRLSFSPDHLDLLTNLPGLQVQAVNLLLISHRECS